MTLMSPKYENENSEHLEYIYNKLLTVYDNEESAEFMVRFKEIIEEMKLSEESFKNYLKFREEKGKLKK